MKRLLIVLLALMVSLPAVADNFLQTPSEQPILGNNNATISTVSSQDDFLPVEQAFRLENTNSDKQGIHLQFIIADGYYLYKSRFAFSSDNPQVIIKQPTLPKGEKEQDEFLGEVEVYHNILNIVVPVTNPVNLAFNLQVKYQGCAAKGLCYPWETANLPIAGILPVPPVTAEASHKILSLSDSWAALSWKEIFSYFGLGLLLAFTPCVYPMLPIISSIVLRGQTGNVRAIILGLTYVLAMSITYAILGVLMGLFGAELNIQARLQTPWVLIPFALFFVIFALAMFGLFEIRLPAAINNFVNKSTDRTRGGSLLSAAVLGISSSLVVSPCVSPALGATLTHIAITGDAIGGGIILFILGLGMGLPFFIFTAGGKFLLPQVGNWMVVVRNILGVMLLGVAIMLIARIVPHYIELVLWGLLAAGVAVFIGALDFSTQKIKLQRLAQLIGLFLLVYAVCVWVGAWQGNTDPLQPLKGQANVSVQTIQNGNNQTNWHIVKTKAQLDKALADAKVANKPVVLDWSADWCRACLEMEHNVFQTQEVETELLGYQLIRMDISETNQEQRALLDHYKLIGPPAILFFDKTGNELVNDRIIGEMGKKDFLAHLAKISL